MLHLSEEKKEYLQPQLSNGFRSSMDGKKREEKKKNNTKKKLVRIPVMKKEWENVVAISRYRTC